MNRIMIGSLAAALVVGLAMAASPAPAEPLDADEIGPLIVDKTFHGVNERDEAFWFWHQGGPKEGTFRAKFRNDQDGTVFGQGTWAAREDEICWTWTSWNNKRFCYQRFEFDAGELAMTRSDGEVHVGTLTAGNSEGL